MSRKTLPILASSLLLLGILLLGRAWLGRSGSQSGESSLPPAGANQRSAASSGRQNPAPDTVTKLATTRPPEPFEASKEVAALLGTGTQTDAEVIAGLMAFSQDSRKPLGARKEAMTHLLNLCSGADHEPSLLELACGPELEKELRVQILADSLNHSLEFRGELMVRLLENPQLGTGTEARERLSELIGEDLGSAPGPWREALKQLAAKRN